MEDANSVEGKRKTCGNQLAIIMSSPSKKLPGNNNFCTPAGQNNCDAMDESVEGVKESNQTGILRYSLRSQLKRPNNSSESDQSQSQEPLTKKPAKCSKQSSTLKLTQQFQRGMKLRDERSTSEIALNIDLIVEFLCRYMNCATLKSCRLVCRRWKYFGAKELQRRRDITTQLSFGYVIDKSKKSVRSLLTLMQNAEAYTFPSASFHVSTEELSSPRIQNFFRVAEARNSIKQLSLALNYEKKKLLWKESTFLEELRDLLFRQLPNLEDLEIFFNLPSHWADELNTWDSGFCHIANSPHLILPKLVSLNLSESLIPRKCFFQLMDAAVNLQFYMGSDFSPELLEYFVDGNGRYRIHLLKHLRFNLAGEFVKVMERLVSLHGHNIKLESFFFFLFWTRQNNGAEFWSRASLVISQLLHSSASTMKTLGITLMRFLPGLAIPRLPKLRTIHIASNFDQNDTDNNFFFPRGFSVAHSFPNLLGVSFIWGSVLRSIEMLSITEPVTSVKHICVGEDNFPISDEIRSRLNSAFPCIITIDGEM